jgi:peptidoglycan/xylan/chitin deacetylase (PgdA/CDA1 family)
MHWLLPKLKGVRVLMYHHVWPGIPDDLTVTPEQLDLQFNYLKQQGYQTIFVSELVQAIYQQKELPPNTVVLTFDDGYKDQLHYVEPLLKKYNFCACIFLIGDKLTNGNMHLNGSKENYLRIEEIQKADSRYFEFGFHSFSHRPLSEMNQEEFKADIELSQQVFHAASISAIPVFAYPYGNRYKERKKLEQAKKIMKEHGIKAAFRIGNSSVSFPVKDPYEMKRIDITGFDDLKRFKIKMNKGKLKPF